MDDDYSAGESRTKPDMLLAMLEPGQLVRGRQPLSQRRLPSGAVLLLASLRIYVVVAVALVIYAFVRALHS